VSCTGMHADKSTLHSTRSALFPAAHVELRIWHAFSQLDLHPPSILFHFQLAISPKRASVGHSVCWMSDEHSQIALCNHRANAASNSFELEMSDGEVDFDQVAWQFFIFRRRGANERASEAPSTREAKNRCRFMRRTQPLCRLAAASLCMVCFHSSSPSP